MLCTLVQARPWPHTMFLTPPGSATALLANPGLRPALLPRVTGRWPAHSAHPTRPAKPSTASRAGGSADWLPHVLPVVALLLSPGVHPPHTAMPPFHTDGRNQTRPMSHQRSCERRWLARHSGRRLATPLPQHSSCTAAQGQARAEVAGLTPRPWLLPLRGALAPLPTAAGLDTSLPGSRAGAGS